MTETFTPYQEALRYVHYNNDEVDIYRTTHHPYLNNGLPWGKEIEVAHNKSKNVYVKIIPGSGSFYNIISKNEAEELMKDGAWLICESRPSNKPTWYDLKPEKV